jgi:hypothetical protein
MHGSARHALAVALVTLAACGDPSGTAGSATLALRPTFAAGTNLDALSLVIDNVHVMVYRPASEELVTDVTTPFSLEAQEVRLTVRVPLEEPSETLFVGVDLRAGTQVLFSGGQDMALTSGASTTPPTPVPLSYFGPGANIAGLIILPRDTTVTTGDSLSFTVTAIDSGQAPVPDFYVGWSTSDSLRGTVNATGLFRAAAVAPARAGVYVVATTPTGVADSVLVTLAAPTPAQIVGTVRHALTGGVVLGATVQVKAGGNAGSGDPVLQSTSTDANGDYAITGLAAGSYTVFVQAANLLTARIPGITLAAGEVRTLDVALSPPQQTGQTRIILSWDSLPPDLDAYLVVPPDTTSALPVVYYGLPGDSLAYPFATLDQDVTSGYGPETITIHQQLAGLYTFMVHDFTTSADSTSLALASSQARVEVYQNNQLVQTFTVPSTPGTLWSVFALNGTVITPLNVITNDPPPTGGAAGATGSALRVGKGATRGP